MQLRVEDEIVALALVVDDARRALSGGVGGEGRLEELMLQEASFSLVVLVDVVQHEDCGCAARTACALWRGCPSQVIIA